MIPYNYYCLNNYQYFVLNINVLIFQPQFGIVKALVNSKSDLILLINEHNE